MNPLSTLFANEQSRFDLVRLQRELTSLQQQVATGRKAGDLKALGGDAAELVASRTLIAQNEARIAASKETTARLEVQDEALGRGAAAVRELEKAVLEAISTNDGRALGEQIELSFLTLRSAMNAHHGGKSLFGGERTDVAPMRVTTTGDLVAATFPTPADYFELSERDQLADLGDAAPYVVGQRAATMSTLAFTAMRDLRALLDAGGGSIGTPLTAAQRTGLAAIAQDARVAAESLDQAQARNGVLLARSEANETRLVSQDTLLRKTTGAMIDANLPEVAMRLQQVQVQYQASAQVFSELKDNTLLNFLR